MKCTDCDNEAVKLGMCEDCIKRCAKEIRDEKAAKLGKKGAAIKHDVVEAKDVIGEKNE